jgi:hypothetical protein
MGSKRRSMLLILMYVLVETICSNLIVSVELWDLLELLDVVSAFDGLRRASRLYIRGSAQGWLNGLAQ